MSRLALALLCALALASTGALPVQRLDKLVRKAFPADGPGAVVVVMQEGRILHTATAGLADIESGTPFDLDTRFDLASVSKAFTAMGVLKLVERGKLALDGDIREHLPELDPKRYRHPIPLANLLGMTAGLPAYEDLVDDLTAVDNAGVARAVGAARPRFRPGAKYEYSNTAYALAALLIQRVSGQSYADFVREAVFLPAGMKDTLVVDRPGVDVPKRATGYHHVKKRIEPARNDTRVVGDGQIITSAREMVLWEKALRAGNLVSPELLKRAFTSGRLTSGKKTEYGFGWSVVTEDGTGSIEHEGSWDGTATFLRIYLDGPALLILSNDGDHDPSALADQLDPLLRE